MITWRGGLAFWPMYVGLILATLLGYQFNFWLGCRFGHKLLQPGRIRWVKRENLNRTESFFSKYGRRAVFVGRFIPLIRTLMPFVAGIAKMDSGYFLWMNVIGGILWMSTLFLAGYFLGHLDFVAQNFLWFYLGMFLVATFPAFLSYFLIRRNSG